MKKFVVPLLVLVALLASTVVALADLPGGPYSSAFRVQNLGTSQANCVYTFYNGSGSAVFNSSNSTINPGDSLYVYVPNVTMPVGVYSGVVSCDQQVAAVVNYSDAHRGTAFAGVNNGATTLYAPAVYSHYYNFSTNMYIQNTGSSAASGVVSIYAPGSSTPAATQTFSNLAPNASVLVEQNGLAGLNTNVAYSAVITGTAGVAAEVNIYGLPGTSPQYQLYSYNPVASGATKAYAPIIMNNYYGFNTALAIQNLGSASTTYTVTYGTGQTQNGTLQPNSSVSLYTPSSGVPSGALTGATVQSSGQPIVLLVNESNTTQRASNYIGFPDGSGTLKISAPIIMKNYYNFETSVTCQNLGTSSATMSIEYANNLGHLTTSSPVLAGKTFLFYQGSDANMLNGISSATITSSQPTVCVVTEGATSALNSQANDYQYTYNGINQ